jgi:Putative glycosyl/glycerophosphate transferases involved in teichoic acid biosynthesis TagF/TagB/EpsJ/RodC
MAPVYFALDESVRGSFYVPEEMYQYAVKKGLDPMALKSPGINNKLDVAPPGNGPVVTAAYGDLQAALRKDPRRPQIFMQHGIGLTFPHSAYAGGAGMQRDVALFLDPNEHTRALIAKTFPHKPGFVIGTPKMDKLSAISFQRSEGKPVVCISFHWDGSAIAPEAGNALKHYAEILPVLAKQENFTMIGHGHPRIMGGLDPYFRSVGIEPVWDFEEVMRRADLYINDCSSTLYEFCITGKPVIILNAPQFRRGMHTGIRFWKYTDVGPMVDEPGELLSAISHQLSAEGNAEYAGARAKAVADLYPYLGQSAKRAAEVIEGFVASKGPAIQRIERVHDESIGILYMCFGAKAATEVRKSMTSLRNLGVSIPVCVVGDTPMRGAQFIEWAGVCPFDASQRENFQFRAGRVKPQLAELTPFERTLYIDADTEFMSDILGGFEMLGDIDLALAQELLSIGQLYNKERAGWEINIQERDQTIKELGGDPNIQFLNSGVIFFRKCEQVRALFQAWGRQWLRYQQWDEQLALMRAMHECTVKYKALSVDWNHPHRNKARIIFHNYGRGVARMNINPEISKEMEMTA